MKFHVMDRTWVTEDDLKYDIDRLERVQRSAGRFITRDYKSREEGCITKMLTDLGLSSLEERRRQQRLTLLYKVVKGMCRLLISNTI